MKTLIRAGLAIALVQLTLTGVIGYKLWSPTKAEDPMDAWLSAQQTSSLGEPEHQDGRDEPKPGEQGQER